MKADKIKAVVFTGAGTTRRVAERFCRATGLAFEVFDVTPQNASLPTFQAGDVALFAVPSYGGRVPAPARAALERCVGDSIPAALLVTYGNRAIDDTLLELSDVVSRGGFVPVGAAAIVAHHSLMTNVATDRPDAQDLAVVSDLARMVLERLDAVCAADAAALGEIPGNRPYRSFGGVPFHPVCNADRCTECGLCAASCPVGAIDPADPSKTDADRCISCTRCIEVCPRACRDMGGGLALAAARKAFALACAKRQESYLIH
ncbi:MAG: 4Fe-4S binding protein [Collinsella sp.]|nr:4Fe-4S binding protein [Collinsella sp.]